MFHANRHIVSVHETIKKECEQLIDLTVCSASRLQVWRPSYHRPGQSKAVDQLDDAQVRLSSLLTCSP